MAFRCSRAECDQPPAVIRCRTSAPPSNMELWSQLLVYILRLRLTVPVNTVVVVAAAK